MTKPKENTNGSVDSAESGAALSERKKQILKAIIDAYIDSGEPVGSKNLASYGNISLSPATIRNEMSELEGMGYLEKPHTSAGRVPSAKGYRLYVDELSEDYRLDMEELELLGELTRVKTAEVESIIDRAGKIISGVTRYAAVSIAGGERSSMTVSRFDAVYVSEHSLLLVMILENGNAKTAQLASELTLTENEVYAMKELLSRSLCGVPLDKVSLDVIMNLEESFGKHRNLVGRILRAAYTATRGEADSDVRIDGLTNLLSYPEFSTVEKARSIVELAESRKDDIKRLLESGLGNGAIGGTGLESIEGENLPGDLRVFIGGASENHALSDTSIVYCTFPMGGTNAVIGILGPKRMDYKKVVASLKYLAQSLGDVGEAELPRLGTATDSDKGEDNSK